MSSAKRPPQQRLSLIQNPYLSHSLKMSLITKLNKIGKRGQPWRTPFLILNNSDKYSISPYTSIGREVYIFNKIIIIKGSINQ